MAAVAVSKPMPMDDNELGVADLLRVLGMGRRSAYLEVVTWRGQRGAVAVESGRLIDARCGAHDGMDALRRLLRGPAQRVRCVALDEHNHPAAHSLESSCEEGLLEAARLDDEQGWDDEQELDAHWDDDAEEESRVQPAAHAVPPLEPLPSVTRPVAAAVLPSAPPRPAAPPRPPVLRAAFGPPVPAPPAPPGAREFEPAPEPARVLRTAASPGQPLDARDVAEEAFKNLLDRALEALLDRRLVEALRAFAAAERVRPGDRRVQHNLARLRELGVQLPEHEGNP